MKRLSPSTASPPNLRLTCVALLVAISSALASACGASDATPTRTDAATTTDAGLGGFSSTPPDGGEGTGIEPVHEDRPLDAGYAFDGATLRADRFVTRVVSFTPGACAGFGAAAMPDVVYGPPRGAGDQQGGYDVVSLGVDGEIVLGFDDAIVDGPGDDFTVFENVFFAGGNPQRPAADLGEVSVSDDGVTWKTYPCDGHAAAPPYGTCAGWHPVYSNPENGISPTASNAGGDRFDLATVGLPRARFVRIRDAHSSDCPSGLPVTNLGFDLDAIVVLNAERP